MKFNKECICWCMNFLKSECTKCIFANAQNIKYRNKLSGQIRAAFWGEKQRRIAEET